MGLIYFDIGRAECAVLSKENINVCTSCIHKVGPQISLAAEHANRIVSNIYNVTKFVYTEIKNRDKCDVIVIIQQLL